MRIAIVDDYAGVSQTVADWSAVEARAELTIFREALDPESAVRALAGFDVICTMRERMAFPAALFEQLPDLKMIVVTGANVPLIDIAAAGRLGILVCNGRTRTDDRPVTESGAPELTWGLLLALARHIPQEDQA